MTLKKYYDSLSRPDRPVFILRMETLLNKSEASVRSYINGHRAIQPQDVRKIVEATDGKVFEYQLRPDVYPVPIIINAVELDE
jgi:DNA-binding transcriptional regulator YdaS (Cro superfamily)